MALVEKEITRCEQCGAPLKSSSSGLGCLNCLLLGGPNESSSESRRLQHYEICLRQDGETLDELGRGAMGVTYRARDVTLDSQVALKIISSRYAGNSDARARFLREARNAAQLRHHNVASVFHFGETEDGQCFYAMELVEGETLEARVSGDGPLPATLALEVAIQVARALLAAEEHGLVHRDLKPGNLMVVASDAGTTDPLLVKVIDFGLAKAITETPPISSQVHVGFSGTPDFASPEQFGAGKVTLDTRSDIYSLGATLWYLLCGRPPFPGRSPRETHEQPLPLEQLTAAKVPAPVISLLRSMLATDPANRPQSARELLLALQRCRQVVLATPRSRRQRRLTALALGLLLIGGISLSSYLSNHQRTPALPSSLPSQATEKSIAILPFENLTNDEQNTYFADGVLEELLANLSKLSELKVISHTSVMNLPRGARQSVKEIAQQLGVADILEGSVQRVGNRVRVNVQLIDARTDTHIWAGRYDRFVEDVFSLESELAQQIATSLQIKLTPQQKSAMDEKPTADVLAYEYYVRARMLMDSSGYTRYEEMLPQAVGLLEDAVERDPNFFLAYCELATAHDRIYLAGVDHSENRLARAAKTIEQARSLRPAPRGELHLALAEHRYCGYFDFDGAIAELAVARQMLPNDSRVFQLLGYVNRRRGRWDESMRDLERAHDLDPRNFYILQQIARSYELLRQYEKELSVLDKALGILPNDQGARLQRAAVEINWHANTNAFHATLDTVLAEDPSAAAALAGQGVELGLLERDFGAAKRALSAMGATGSHYLGLDLPRSWSEGVLARYAGDAEEAKNAFIAARKEVAEKVRQSPDYAELLSVLGMIDANLSRKADAIREGKRAIELLPTTRDSTDGPLLLENLAYIYVLTGEKALACQQLALAAQVPGDLSYGELQLHPDWDPLRAEPRFQEVIHTLAPK